MPANHRLIFRGEEKMNFRAKYALLAVFIGVTLVMPMCAGSATSTPRLNSSVQESTVDGPESIQAMEVVDSFIDPWGGVYNVVGGAYNATQYGFSHITALQNVVKNQMQNDDGYVSMSVFELSGMTAFPNGVVGGPTAMLEIVVSPVIIVPTLRENTYFADLSQAEAIALADAVAATYETALTIDLQRFMTVQTEITFSFSYDIYPSVFCEGISYMMTYMALLTADQGIAAMNALLARLASLGGVMSLLGAPNWPELLTSAVETYIPHHFMPHYETSYPMVMNMFGSVGKPYIRSGNVNDTQTVQSLVVAGAAFNYPGYVTAVDGNETYSLKTHVGYTGNIENKMQQDSSAMSILAFGGQAPSSLTMYGIPAGWLRVNDQFQLPANVTIGDFTIPANSTISDAIRMVLSYLPRQGALSVNEGIGGLNNTMLDFIADFWSSPGLLIDLRDMVLALNYTLTTPVTEMNYDLLASMMRRAGMTPDTLVSKIDSTLAAKSPVGALVKAFVGYFDSYHVLDILEADNYANAPAFAAYLNTFIGGVEKALHDFGGLDVTTQFTTKEGIATFVEEHWGIVLQALWTAMAANDLPGVKSAFHNILDPTNLQEHITPYLMADLGSSLIAGLGFQFAVNFNGTTLFPLSTSDLSLSFEADPASLDINGPYLAIVKGTSTRTVTEGQIVTFNITVHNYGDATAYDVKVLDGICAGLDGERPYYWTKSTLAAGETWLFDYQVTASDAGLYMDMPAICVYFNQSLSTFDPAAAENWTGSARYTLSAIGYQILVEGGSWWPSTLFGIPTLYVVAGVGGVAVLGVALLVIRRRG